MPFLQIIKELAMSFFIGGLAAAGWVVPMTDLLYKFQFTAKHILTDNKVNAEFIKLHGHKSGTPTLGGILIWITVPLALIIFFPHSPLILGVSYLFLIVGGYGFLDGFLDMITKNNLKFREFQNGFGWRVLKLLVALLINFLVAYLIVYIIGIKTIDIFSWKLVLNEPFGFTLLAMVSLFSLYATEIIDGLDALAAGMYMITLLGFVLIILALPLQFFIGANGSALAILGVVIGVLTVYLYFNIPPARFFMGGPGAMPMGPFFLTLAVLGNVMPLFLVLMLPYFIDLASSGIQIVSLKFFKRRVFKIAPLHHYFEAIGWPEYKVVMRFWLFNGVIIFLAILIQLLILS